MHVYLAISRPDQLRISCRILHGDQRLLPAATVDFASIAGRGLPDFTCLLRQRVLLCACELVRLHDRELQAREAFDLNWGYASYALYFTDQAPRCHCSHDIMSVQPGHKAWPSASLHITARR